MPHTTCGREPHRGGHIAQATHALPMRHEEQNVVIADVVAHAVNAQEVIANRQHAHAAVAGIIRNMTITKGLRNAAKPPVEAVTMGVRRCRSIDVAATLR